MKVSRRYLPLFDEQGEWNERPEFLILAALCETEEISRDHLYAAMCREEEVNPAIAGEAKSNFADGLGTKRILRNTGQRVIAGEVVIAFARLVAAKEKPSVRAAQRLVARDDFRRSKSSSPENKYRGVQAAVSDYRSTLHLQAAFVYVADRISDLLGTEEGIRLFLGIARAFETIVDEFMVSDTFSWDPWRIPEQISYQSFSFPPLSSSEVGDSRPF